MMDGWTMTGWGWGWMTLTMVIPVVIVAVVLLAIARGFMPPRRAGSDDAQSVLRRRFAAGEIDEDEFQRRRAALNAPGGSSDASSP